MFGFRYVKASPSTYVIQYKNGKPVREGTGLTFWYFAPSATLVSIPLESVDAPFMFQEVSSDFQVVTVQGQVTYRVSAPTTLASLMNFTLKPDGTYASEDRIKLPQRVVNAVQVQLRSVLQSWSAWRTGTSSLSPQTSTTLSLNCCWVDQSKL